MTGEQLKAKVLKLFDQWSSERDPAECAAVASDIAEELETRAGLWSGLGDDSTEDHEVDEPDGDYSQTETDDE